MGGSRTPGPVGGDVDDSSHTFTPGGLGDTPGTISLDSRPRRRVVRRVVTAVTKDWDPPQTRGTPAIVVNGRTLEQAGRELMALGEWGQGGGRILNDRIPADTSTEVTVQLHANLVKRLPTWAQYRSASTAVKAEWDRMMRALTAHENRHVEIAIEEANQCAAELIGVEIDEVPGIVTQANRRMAARQSEYDTDTQNGQSEGVDLDTSIK
jgi:hypothetical protein